MTRFDDSMIGENNRIIASSHRRVTAANIYSLCCFRVLLRGWLICWNCFGYACFIKKLFGHDSVGIVFPSTGDQLAAVEVFPKTEVSWLQRAHNDHYQDIQNLLKDRFGPGLDWIRKSREVLEASGNTDERTKAKRAEILGNRTQNNINLLVAEIDVPLAGNDRVSGVEDEGLNAHLSICSLQI